jgi:hypothetical protein
MIMVAFLILSVMLMVYYVLRLVTLYIGAVLSPIVFLLWLLPDFKHFAEAAARAYIAVIFVLFIHVVILELAASIFGGMVLAAPDHALNPLMSLVVGIATVLALLKTQGVLTHLTMASLGPKTSSQLGGLVSNLAGHYLNRQPREVAFAGISGDMRGDTDTSARAASWSSKPPSAPMVYQMTATERTATSGAEEGTRVRAQEQVASLGRGSEASSSSKGASK